MIDGEMCEVALARTERKIVEGYKGFEVVSNAAVTIEEDLSRRDLTVNAMAIELVTGALVDPFGGKVDVENEILRATTEAFKEDPLRVYRVARFAGRCGFTVDKGTLKMMGTLKSELNTLSYERVIEETKKALLTDTPSKYFRVLKEAGVLSVHFPEINILSEYDQPEKFHPEGNVFEHTMQVLDAARYLSKSMPVVNGESTKKRVERELKLCAAALLHDVGKAVTKGVHPKTGVITYREHESAGVPIAAAFMERYNLVSWGTAVQYGVANHMLMHRAIGEMKTPKLVDLIDNKFVMKNHVDEKGRAQKYERVAGIKASMGVTDFIVLCMADVAGRLSDKRNLQAVLEIVNGMGKMYADGEYKEAGELGESVYNIVGAVDEAGNLLIDIEDVLRNKLTIEMYEEESNGLKISKDIGGLTGAYDGEDLGYAIHEDKRKQRINIMNNVRKRVKEKLGEH